MGPDADNADTYKAEDHDNDVSRCNVEIQQTTPMPFAVGRGRVFGGKQVYGGRLSAHHMGSDEDDADDGR